MNTTHLSRYESATSFEFHSSFPEWWNEKSAAMRIWQKAYPEVFGERLILRVDDLIIFNLTHRRQKTPLLEAHPLWYDNYALIGRDGEQFFGVNKDEEGVWRLKVGPDAVIESKNATIEQYVDEILTGLTPPTTTFSADLVDRVRRTLVPPVVTGDIDRLLYVLSQPDGSEDGSESDLEATDDAGDSDEEVDSEDEPEDADDEGESNDDDDAPDVIVWCPDFEEHDLDEIKQFLSLHQFMELSWRSRRELAERLLASEEWFVRENCCAQYEFVSNVFRDEGWNIEDQLEISDDPEDAQRFDRIAAFDLICELMDHQGDLDTGTVFEPVLPTNPEIDYFEELALSPAIHLPLPLAESEAVLRQRAAPELEEFKQLVALWEAPGAVEPMEAYATWLEGNEEEAKLKIVRAILAEFAEDGDAEWPDDSEDSAWYQMVLFHTCDRLRQSEQTGSHQSLFAFIRPMVTLTAEPFAEEMIAVGASKFGGNPDLPDGFEWPACPQGPLGFLMQLRVRDLHGTIVGDRWKLPKDGLISIFVYQNYEEGYCPGGGEKIPDDLKIVFTPAGTPLVRWSKAPELGEGNGPFPSALVAMKESVDIPTGITAVPEALREHWPVFNDTFEYEFIHSFREERKAHEHHLGGYPVHFHGELAVPEGFTHFITLHSDDTFKWCWQDDHHLSLFVQADDLENHSFGRVHAEAM